jgi:hypothetical protein
MGHASPPKLTPMSRGRLFEVVRMLGWPTATLLYKTGWMLRRRDVVELLSDTWARQESSVDVSIPMTLRAITPARDGARARYAVPIMLLPKIPPTMMNFHFRSGAERLTLPTRRQNGLASYAALLAAARAKLGWPLPKALREQLLFVAIGPPEYAAAVSWRMRAPRGGAPSLPQLESMPTVETAEDELQRWCAQMQGIDVTTVEPSPDAEIDPQTLLKDLAEDDLTCYLLRKLALNSIVLAHMPRSDTGQQSVSLTCDANLYKENTFVSTSAVARRGWIAYEMVFQTPFVGASSYHFEYFAPSGVEVIDSQLLEDRQEDEWDPQGTTEQLAGTSSEAPAVPATAESVEPVVLRHGEQSGVMSPSPVHEARDEDNDDELGWPEYDYVPTRGERVHLYRAKDDVPDVMSAQLFLRVQRERFIGPAALAGVGVAVTLLLCAVLTRPLISHANGAQALLLVVPGLLATIIARAGEHALTIRMLQGARRTLLSTGVLGFLGAGFLGLIHTGKGAHAAAWDRWVYIVLAVAAVWQAAKLVVARILPRGSEPSGWLEAWVDRRRAAGERSAQRKSKWRQRALRLRLTAPPLNWERAREIVDSSGKDHCLPMRVGRRRRKGRSGDRDSRCFR